MMLDKYVIEIMDRTARLGTQIMPVLQSCFRDRPEDVRKKCVPSKTKRAHLRAARKAKAKK
jgi:ribosomal protein L23